MSRRPAFSLCVVPVLATVLLASDREAVAPDSPAADPANEPGAPALFSWGDVDGDGRLDLAAVSVAGTLRLLVNAGDGRFEDVTEKAGLADVGTAAIALWADYDADGRLDLFVGARQGTSRLFHNEGGLFADMTAASGLSVAGTVRSAHWFDADSDNLLDLFLVTDEESSLFHGVAGGFFVRAELPEWSPTGVAPGGAPISGPGTSGPSRGEDLGATADGRKADVLLASHVASFGTPTPSGGSGSVLPLMLGPSPACAPSIEDQANPVSCLSASSTPTLGNLFPLTTSLFVTAGGSVGIGTNNPGAKLECTGTVRFKNTLTLVPSGDIALNVSTGSIYKDGALFIHNKGGSGNTAIGEDALSGVTTGANNTACGDGALQSNTTGGNNTALGANAGSSRTTGSNNIDIGHLGVAGESATMRIGTAGTHTRAFIAGIRGVTTLVPNAIPVLIDSTGQLGTTSSSRRFKKDIADMGDLSDRLRQLRPVVFHYTQEQELPNGGEVPLEYGLIAEEVAEIFPELVVYDEEGQPFTVKYHLLSSMLLNEVNRLSEAHTREMEELRGRLAALESRASTVTPVAGSQ